MIHLLNGLVLLGVIRRAGVADDIAAVATLLWLVHPVLSESVVYITQRTEMLMGLFFLLMFYCFLRSLDSTGGRLWQLAAVLACGLGMGCKEVMAVAPVLVLAYDYVFVTGSLKRSLRERRALYAGLAATWLMLPLLIGGVSLWAKMGNRAEGLTPWNTRDAVYDARALPAIVCLAVGLMIDYEAWPRVHSVREILPKDC